MSMVFFINILPTLLVHFILELPMFYAHICVYILFVLGYIYIRRLPMYMYRLFILHICTDRSFVYGHI